MRHDEAKYCKMRQDDSKMRQDEARILQDEARNSKMRQDDS